MHSWNTNHGKEYPRLDSGGYPVERIIETYPELTRDDVAAALDVRRSDAGRWVTRVGISDDTALTQERCAAVGAVVTMHKKTGTPEGHPAHVAW